MLLRFAEIEAEYQKQKAKLDEEYKSFLDEVGVGAPPPKSAKALDDYESFMSGALRSSAPTGLFDSTIADLGLDAPSSATSATSAGAAGAPLATHGGSFGANVRQQQH